MRNIFIVFLLLISITVCVDAQVIMTETFNYQDGQLDADKDGTGANVSGGNWIYYASTSNPYYSLNPITVSGTGLTYSGYSLSGLGKKVDVANNPQDSSQDRCYRRFPTQTGKIYYSFLINVKDLLYCGTSVKGQYFLVLFDSTTTTTNGTSFGLAVISKDSANPTRFRLGVRPAQPATLAGFCPTLLDTLTTYLVVISYDMSGNGVTSLDSAKIWVNPDLNSPEPQADAVIANVTNDKIHVGRLAFYQRDSGPRAILSGFKVTKSWTNLSPEFSMTPTSLDFKTVPVGFNGTPQLITISNSTGSTDLNVTPIQPVDTSYSITPPFASIPAGGSNVFTVTFSPKDTGNYNQTIQFTHNGANSPGLLYVSGIGTKEEILLTETFDYPDGALTNVDNLNHGSPYYPINPNVSDSVWVNPSSSTFDDPLIVGGSALTYPGYSLSGIGKQLFCPNMTGNTSSNRAYRQFSSQTGKVYYSLLLKMKELTNLSSNTSAKGDYLTGLWPADNATNANYRGLLCFRLGSTPGTYQLGLMANQPMSSASWVTLKNLDTLTTYLIVVSFERSPVSTASLWINPDLSGQEIIPDTVSNFGAADPINLNIGRMGIYQRSSGRPKLWLSGIRVSNSWTNLTPAFSVNHNNLDFGSIDVGTTSPGQLLTVTNTGNISLTISSVVLKNTQFTVTPGNAMIAIGGSADFSVAFSPTMTGPQTGSIIFNHNGVQTPDTVVLIGTALDSLTNVQIPLSTGWNIVSVPLNESNLAKDSIFERANSNAYTFENGYVAKDILEPGVGYWIKYTSGETILRSGQPFVNLAINVKEGWNMIGGTSVPLGINQITVDSVGLTTSNFYEYKSGYSIVDTLLPGKGYWVKVSQAGRLYLNTDTVNASMNPLTIISSHDSPPEPPSEYPETEKVVPETFSMDQNYPNPFNPTTSIRYGLPKDAFVTIAVYNTLGQQVLLLVNEFMNAGYHEIQLHASNLTSGVYYYRVQADNFVETKKLLLMK